MDLLALTDFKLVAQHGGFGKAAQASGRPKATLSRRVMALEESLGLRLLERSSRAFRLTEEGLTTRREPGEWRVQDTQGTEHRFQPQPLLRLSSTLMVRDAARAGAGAALAAAIHRRRRPGKRPAGALGHRAGQARRSPGAAHLPAARQREGDGVRAVPVREFFGWGAGVEKGLQVPKVRFAVLIIRRARLRSATFGPVSGVGPRAQQPDRRGPSAPRRCQARWLHERLADHFGSGMRPRLQPRPAAPSRRWATSTPRQGAARRLASKRAQHAPESMGRACSM